MILYDFGKHISLEDIKKFPNLYSLAIGFFCEVDCSVFSEYRLDNLLYLEIKNCDIKNEQFVSLCKQSQLDALFVEKNNITNIDCITNLANLIRLDLHQNNVIDISSLGLLSNLEWVRVRENNIVNIFSLKNYQN